MSIPTPVSREAVSQAAPTLDAILAPIHQGFEQSGLTDEEIDGLFREAREEAWQERQRQQESA